MFNFLTRIKRAEIGKVRDLLIHTVKFLLELNIMKLKRQEKVKGLTVLSNTNINKELDGTKMYLYIVTEC